LREKYTEASSKIRIGIMSIKLFIHLKQAGQQLVERVEWPLTQSRFKHSLIFLKLRKRQY